jgi:hypothetical protein
MPSVMSQLWHARFSHQGVAVLPAVASLYQLKIPHLNMSGTTASPCIHCLNGHGRRSKIFKATANSKNLIPATRPGQRLHCDLSGPVSTKIGTKSYRVPTTGGAIYLLAVVDEYSRYTFAKVLPYKHMVPAIINEIVEWFKNHLGLPVSEIHSDGGTEFINQYVTTPLKAQGGTQTRTTVDTPQHNGIAERTIGTLFEMERSQRSHSGAPQELWGESILHAAYVRNRTPRVILNGQSSYHRLFQRAPDISKLRIFGCTAHIQTPADYAGKIDMRYSTGCYLGVSEQHNAYIVLVPGTNKVLYSRDVKFNENDFTVVQSHYTATGLGIEDSLVTPDDENTPDITLDTTGPPRSSGTSPVPDSVSRPLRGTTSVTTSVYDPSSSNSEELHQLVTGINNNEASGLDLADLEAPGIDLGDHVPLEYHNRTPRPHLGNPHYNNVTDEAVALPQRGLAPSVKRSSQDSTVQRAATQLAYPTDTSAIVHLPTVPSPFVTKSGRTIHKVQQYGRPDEGDYLYSVKVQEHYLFSAVVSRLKESEPMSYKEAMTGSSAPEWTKSMREEIESLHQAGAWILVEAPRDATVIRGRWVYKLKHDSTGAVARYKSRFVCKGFQQTYGVDYVDTYAPVVAPRSVKLVLCIGAELDLEMKQLDFDTAFLNAPVTETIYCHQPEGFKANGEEHLVCKLQKALYGLKQAPRCWNQEIDSTMISLGYHKCTVDPCVYTKHGTIAGITDTVLIIICIYVDDTVVAYNKAGATIWEEDKAALAAKYHIKDLGDVDWILNMKVVRDRSKRTVTLSQETYVNRILEKFNMVQCKPASVPGMQKDFTDPEDGTDRIPVPIEGEKHSLYRSLIGALLYAANTTRIDIAYTVGTLSRYLGAPCEHHIAAALHVLRYLAGTAKYSMQFGAPKEGATTLKAFTDADWAGDKNERRSTTGAVILYQGYPISWYTKLQPSIAKSTAEAEFIALARTTDEVMWYRDWLKEVLYLGTKLVPLVLCDNKAAIAIVKNGTTKAPSAKHIAIKYHFVATEVLSGTVVLDWCDTSNQLADILTKVLTKQLHQPLVSKLLHTNSVMGGSSV